MITNEHLDNQVRASFRRTPRGFVSNNLGVALCPQYTIAAVAMHQVAPGAELDLPEGYDKAMFALAHFRYGWLNTTVEVPVQEARDYAHIGQQLLRLNEAGAIHPPLRTLEIKSIEHLLAQVAELPA